MEQSAYRIVEDETGGATLEARVTALEGWKMTVVQQLSDIKGNTDEILMVVKTGKAVGGFLYRWGPKVITFGAGAFTVLGVGNAKFWDFIRHLFS